MSSDIERLLGTDITGHPTHEYKLYDADGSEMTFTFFQHTHNDDRGDVAIFTKIETEIGDLTPTFILRRTQLASLIEVLKKELDTVK